MEYRSKIIFLFYCSGNKLFVAGIPAVCREEGIGIAFLTNSPGKVGSRVVPDFLDMWFERVEVPERIDLTEK
ncbi:MAG: hypothetical protein P1P82_14940 [Bacteroidales bacterium]|nr:hypothetical protein [Bacteroidales bacterium]MDT8432111.1 hypothetical protein [Bacteroidales bacterium]